MRRKKGFTLIELLVVIAIIALLLAILMPALQKIKKQARRVICGTSMHDWGVAIVAFAADNDNFFPNNGRDPIRNSYNLSAVSGAMSQFFEDYLLRLDDNAANSRANILFCPTNSWERAAYRGGHAGRDLQFYLDIGMVGYLVLFGNDEGLLTSAYSVTNYTPPTCPNGLKWVTRKKLGGRYSRGPILSDVMYTQGRDEWVDPTVGVPLSSHPSSKDDAPEGGYFLFEDGSTNWYRGVDIGTGGGLGGGSEKHSFHGGQVSLGSIQGPWRAYYGLPDVR